jgi:integrase/recombinase XerD
MKALKAVPKAEPYFLWSGNGTAKGRKGNWRALKRLSELAEVPSGHAHRFRDTFAVKVLLAGIHLERVSIYAGVTVS